jgi:hypothetical protein
LPRRDREFSLFESDENVRDCAGSSRCPESRTQRNRRNRRGKCDASLAPSPPQLESQKLTSCERHRRPTGPTTTGKRQVPHEKAAVSGARLMQPQPPRRDANRTPPTPLIAVAPLRDAGLRFYRRPRSHHHDACAKAPALSSCSALRTTASSGASAPTTMGWRIRQGQSSAGPLFLFLESCRLRSASNGLSQSTIRALVAHRWKSVGGAQSWDMVDPAEAGRPGTWATRSPPLDSRCLASLAG